MNDNIKDQTIRPIGSLGSVKAEGKIFKKNINAFLKCTYNLTEEYLKKHS